LYVPVAQDTLDKLGRIARRERRHPKDQAAIPLEQAIVAAEPAPPDRTSANPLEPADGKAYDGALIYG
jgi:hypothetical protein